MYKPLRIVSFMLAFSAFSACPALAAGTSAVNMQATQENNVCKGVVTDSHGEPLAGVSVIVKGTQRGTTSNTEGNFSLPGVKNGDVIQVSFIGFKSAEAVWNGKAINFVLKDDSELLSEVVVTAMGIKRESKSLAYSAQTVGGKDVNEIKNINMINSLQGKSAGLSITPNSTGAGGASKILFRGS